MATRFEIVLHGTDAVRLRAAGEEALAEIERLDRQLSLYNPASEIFRVNRDAHRLPVRVTPELFQLLQRAQRLHAESLGTFDITIGPLVRCWGFMGGSGAPADPIALADARSRVGMKHILLDEREFTVAFECPGMMLDLGAIGKGYALEVAVSLLREAGVTDAMLHGGTSTVCATGKPADTDAWKIAIEYPPPLPGSPSAPERVLAVVALHDEALSVSAVWGKSFQADGRTFGHVIDPRSGEPVSNAVLAAVVLESATDTDALSTALLTLGHEGHDCIAASRPKIKSLVVSDTAAGGFATTTRGIELHAAFRAPM
jgi:FAD:protein FMN transferase